MKKVKTLTLLVLSLLMLTVSVTGCGPKDGQTQEEKETGKVSIEFWGWADAMESEIYQAMVDTFNESQDEIWVNYTKKPGGDYERSLVQALGSRNAPDIFYVPEANIKTWVAQGLIADITDFVKKSEVIDLDDIWESLVERYTFDKETFQYSKDAPIWGLPKDLGVSVIYYNADALRAVGINILSIPENEITDPSEAHGFYEKDGQYYFNNRIAMTWEELVACSKLLTRRYNEKSPTVYGYYDDKWYSYVWSVGGNSLKYIETDDPAYNGGYYEWVMDSTEPNVIDGKVLPSTREAVEFWISLSRGDNPKYGLTEPVSPVPTVVTGTYSMFTDAQCAMFVIPRYAVPTFRRDCAFEWDAAPMPRYKDGVQAGYSTAMSYSIAENSSDKEAAFKFMEFMAGPAGQAELAKYGFNVPTQKSVTHSDAFMVTDKAPFNNAVFAEGAEYEEVGDWMYLPDTAWSDYISFKDVLNGYKTLDEMFNNSKATVNEYLKRGRSGAKGSADSALRPFLWSA